MTTQLRSHQEYLNAVRECRDNPEQFWAEQAESFVWHKKWDSVLNWNFDEPKIEWFKGGKLNITENCLDRHLETRGDQPAIIWEANDPKAPNRTITYRDLYA